jgi:hypothetical protein
MFANEVYNPGKDSCEWAMDHTETGNGLLCLLTKPAESGNSQGFCVDVNEWHEGSLPEYTYECHINSVADDIDPITDISKQQYESCAQQIKNRCAYLGYPQHEHKQ